MISRRALLKKAGAALLLDQMNRAVPPLAHGSRSPLLGTGRPRPEDRKFRSETVEQFLRQTAARINDPELAALFGNCFLNTLDTTVEPGLFEGRPDTAVITGDIPAMWLRDSSAQVWPYLRLASDDKALRALLEGVIRRQTRCLLIDPYANAFMADLSAPPLKWARSDRTEMKQGVAERKYELDSLCYPIRLAHGYWGATGDTRPFDSAWKQAMHVSVSTMQIQQRKRGNGPYSFMRSAEAPTETLPNRGFGSPVKPVGLIASGFRPSDDACTFPFHVPANLFAVTSLRQLASMSAAVLNDQLLAQTASDLASEVEKAARQYTVASTPLGPIWAYEVDGFGSQILMDDANLPSLLGLPYLDSSPDAHIYARTREFVWSNLNPWFFSGTAGEGIGGPHEGVGMIWPMSQIVYALTSQSDNEVSRMLVMVKQSSAGTGFMHESYSSNDVAQFTRPWFAWVNSLFGELIARLVGAA